MDDMPLHYYFDANALFKFYHEQHGGLTIRRLVANSPTLILVSPLTVLECFGVIMRYQRKKLLKRKQAHALFKRLRKDMGSRPDTHRPFLLIPISASIYQRAESLLLQHAGQWQFGSNDALHLAIAETLQADHETIMTTSDRAMKHVCERLNIPVWDAEKDGPSLTNF
ncbi:type II toxin-antitoxin system VapC family toxin [Candidatus Venteria ishoeyi]|uniref:PIN domain-containing protein n=1 Tax=Candidatus Venteria ishoeyi TaxID=1899563 RepID=A0A1H6FDL7_9GAMM|nr:type II toxin-antitoxin system VapC family toxin [Candidatus Venteria ishoeyi]SEH07491.1 Uncharacterised protein [Candidatus Venteria ishoeyi]